jgi:hypothetical protein
LLGVALLAIPALVRAEVRVLASDATGVTLQFTLPPYKLTPIDRPEGGFYLVESGGLSSSLGEEGRPAFPAEAKLLAIPAGTIPHVTVSDEVFETAAGTDGREPEPVGKSVFEQDGTSYKPTRAFFRDAAVYDGRGAWPVASAELGAAGRWRYQQVVPLRIQPFRYEASTRTLRALRSATVRVDFAPDSRRGPATATSLDAFPKGSELGPRTDAGSEGLYREGLLNYEAGRDFRIAPARPARTAARALGSSNPEWALRVDTTGVWRVTYAQLAARAFPSGVATAELSLVRRDYAQDTNPPFIEVPIPIRVIEGATGTAGVFDAADAIEFYGQNWRERTRPGWARGRFTDSETFFLSWITGGAPARILEVSADRGLSGLPRPASFPSFRHYERRYWYNAYPRDTCQAALLWTDPFGDAAWSDTLTAFTPDPDPTGTVRFRASFIGAVPFPNTHTNWMRWKRPSDGLLTSVRTKAFSGNVEDFSDTTFAADRIASGSNKIEYRGYAFISTEIPEGWSGSSLRYYEVTYSRLYRAFRNMLDLNSSDASGDFEIEVDGFTAATQPAVTVYDVSDSTAPRALLVPAGKMRQSAPGVWAATFQDAAVAGTPRRYFAVLAAPTLPDAAVSAGAAHAWEPPGTPGYLIVTPDEFLAPAQQLAAHRRSQGHDVQVVTMAAVAEAFDGGRKTDYAIRRYFEFAFATWGSRLGMLFGDGSTDARNELGESARNWIPVHLIPGPVGVAQGNEISPSEFWYVSDLPRTDPVPTGCFAFEPTPDLFGDMSLGRLPAGSPAEAQGLVDKLIAYDTQDRQGAWRNRVLLVADDAYSTSDFTGAPTLYCYKTPELVFERIGDSLSVILTSEAGYRDLDIQDYNLRERLLPVNRPLACMGLGPGEGYALTNAYMSSFTRPQFLTKLGEGALVVNFQGHGSAIILAHEGLFNSYNQGLQDIDFVTNDGKPFFFLSYSCHVNNFANPREASPFGAGGDALGENMVLGPRALGVRPLAGAIGSYASTNFELLPGDPSGHNHLNLWHFRALFVTPPSDQYAGERGARVLVGEAMNLGSAMAVANINGLEKRAVQTYCLLGDPATPINTGAPRFYATANSDPIVSGVRYQPTAAGDSIVIDADIVDESRIDDLVIAITGEGARALTPGEIVFTPTYPDTANGGGGRRYHIVWTLAPEAKDVDLSFSFHDRTGLANSFVLPLRLEAALFANGQRINSGGTGPTSGDYHFTVTSPAQLTPGDMTLTVDGAPVSGLVVTPAATDTTGRVWTLTWPAELSEGPHVAAIAFTGGATRSVSFSTSDVARVALQKVFAFPTPFANPPVTFNFTLDSDQIVDVLVKVYTVSGDLVWQRKETGLGPGYHQLVWDGLDTQGDGLANGTYLYRVLAVDDRGLKAVGEGKLVRLR